MKRNLFFNWECSDHFGWGIYGLNLLEWSRRHALYRPMPLLWPPTHLHPVDPLTQRLYDAQERDRIVIQAEDVMLTAVGNWVLRQPEAAGITEIGVIFSEPNPLPEDRYRQLAEFDAIITGSSWNQRTLSERGLRCHVSLQGVDTDLFRYQPKRRMRDRFVVFSGGQLAYRKGQDLILKAFSLFAPKHPDAVLMTAWRSPWEGPAVTASINAARMCEPLVLGKDVQDSIAKWVQANGIPANQFIDLGIMANRLMPEIFREVDIAVFPNRCEAGTNLVAMEALSSGVRCAISRNTGHLDIIRPGNCVPLVRQQPIGAGLNLRMQDWGDSDVEEILSVLQGAYDGTLGLDTTTIRESMRAHSWERSIAHLLDQVQLIQG